MTVAIYIAHAGWDEGRKPHYTRLIGQLGRHRTLESRKPEHASVWAQRLWRTALDGDETHSVFLNDDVILPPNFRAACEAVTESVPDQVIALHTINAHGKAPWFRSYWLTGPAYIIPRALLPNLLAFCEEWKDFAARFNEDNVVMQWSWGRQQPVWHCVPALVKHDVTAKSTLGYDGHPNRVTRVPWDEWPEADIASVEYWRQGTQTPPLVECPWMSMGRLQSIQARRGKICVCAACSIEDPGIEFGNGNGICRSCLAHAARAAIVGQ